MATSSRDSDPKPVPNNSNVVFIDTNLDTHLATIVSDHDTVSDLKKRILSEHPLCFPKVGQIQIHAIKVKRKEYFYHLSDSMLVKSAFHGFIKSWFLSVDAYTVGEHGQNKQVCSAGSPNQVACLTNANNALIGPVDIAINREKEECHFVTPAVSEHNQNEVGKKLEICATSFGNNDTRFPLPGSIPETHCNCYVNHKLPHLQIECEIDGSSNGVKDDRNVCEKVSLVSLANAKKRRRKKREKEGTVEDNASNKKIASDDNLLSFALKKVSSYNNFEVSQLENKQDEIKEIPFVSSHDSEHTGEKLVNKESKDQFKSNDDISRDGVEYNHKGKEKSGDKSLSNKNLSVISDFNVDNISHQFLEVKQMIKNSSAEHFNNADPLRTIEHGGRMKGKKKSLNSHEKPVVTSSGKDDEADRSIIQGSVQEEISEDGRFSKGVSMSKTTLENMKIGIDACKEGSPFKLKKTGNYKNHCVIDMKGHPSDVNEPKELPEDDVNFVLECDHKSEARQVEGSEEAREVLPQIDPNPMLVVECTPSNQDNADANIRGLNMTSRVDVNGIGEPVKSEKKRKSKDSPSSQDNADANIRGLSMTSRVDVNGMAEPVKSEKKKRKKRTSKDSNGGPTLMECISPVGASESKAIFAKSLNSKTCDPASGNIETEENPLNHIERKTIQQEEMKGTVSSATGQEDDVRTDNSGSMEQIKTKAHAEQVDKRQRIKANNNKKSAFKSVSDVLTKDDLHDSKKPSPSSDSLICATRSGKISKKFKSVSTKSPKKSSETNLDPAKHSVEREHSDSRFVPACNASSQFPSNTPKGSYNLEDATAKDSTHSPVKQDDNNLEETLKPHKINADQQILSQQLQHEANMSDVLVDKMNGSDREDLDLMNGQNARKPEETKGKTHAESLSSSLKLSSKVGHGVLKIHPAKKVPTVHETGRRAKLSSPSNSAISSIREKRKPKVNASGKLVESKKRREGLPISNSVLEGSNKIVQKKAQKASENNVGKVVGKTQQKKSLLAGAIFEDDSSGTSEYVHEADKSDASIRTPSDTSPMSDFSDSNSSAGSHGGKRLENGGRSALTATMPIDHILRSSSRYKKAKITASQLEGTESQPEFAADSLNDM